MGSFGDFVSTVFQKETPVFEYFNGFTTISMCNPEKRMNILDIRKTWVINNFVDFASVDTKQYYDFYEKNVQDPYAGTCFNPPPCFANNDETPDNVEEDDIDIHYRDISNKYEILMKRFEKEEDETSYISETKSEDSQDFDYMSLTDYTDFDDVIEEEFYDELSCGDDDYDY